MDLRHYLHILRRQRWLILATTLIVGVTAGLFATLQTPKYQATTQVLLRPDDPSEQLNQSVQPTNDLPRYVSEQAAIVRSLPVAQAVARARHSKAPAEQLLSKLSVSSSDTSNVLGITVTDTSALQARALANAFAHAYLADRRSFDLSRLQQAVDAIAGKLTALQSQINRLTAPGATSVADRTALQLATTQYSNLLAEQQNLQVEMDLKHGEAEIIAPAVTPSGPATPRRSRDILLGLIAGLLLGVVLALVREQMDTSIRSVEDAEESTELKLLGQIPFDPAARHRDGFVAVRDDSTSAAAEAVRALRTAVDLHPGRPDVPRIVVTSPGRGDGKTLVAANLAAAFAEAGHRTLLVSADLRHPRVEKLFGVSRSPGIADYMLSEGVPAHGLVASTNVRNLYLLRAGNAVGNPAAMFMTMDFDELLTDVTAGLDVVLFDSPPVLAVTDATILSAQADAVLLVVAEDGTSREEAHRARTVLETTANAVVLGLVVNKVPASGNSFQHYSRPVVR